MAGLCPLLVVAKSGAAECSEECAWYVKHTDPESEGCAIKGLSDDLKFISLRIAELSLK